MAKSVKTGNTGRSVNSGSTVIPSNRSSSEKTGTNILPQIFLVSLTAYIVLLIFSGVLYPYRYNADGKGTESEVSIIKVSENSTSEETFEETSEEVSEEVSEETSETKYSAIKNRAQNFHFVEKIDVTDEEIDLLARVIMCESSICDLMEKYYVGNVVLNRVISPDFPDTITEVIYQGYDEGEPQYASVEVLFNDTPPQEYYSIARNLLFGGVRVLDDEIVFQTGFDPSDWASVVFKTDWHYYSKSMYADQEVADSEVADSEVATFAIADSAIGEYF